METDLLINKKTIKIVLTLIVISFISLIIFIQVNSNKQIIIGEVIKENIQKSIDFSIISNNEFLPGLNKSFNSLNQAKSSTIIDLNNSDTYTISADIIKKNIYRQELILYAYNEMIPGPTLRVNQGSKIKIIFKNNIDMNTTIHWHGLRHDIKNDGVPDISQDPVQPGESFTYELYFPDDGIFWYHPHVREDIGQDLGLAGNIIVVPKIPYNPVNREELLFIDDILLNSDGQLKPFGKVHTNFAIMGRFGNVMLINGETFYDLTVNKSEIVRFYITNVANVRPFNLSIQGVKLKIVGGDLGQYEKEEFIDSIIISPAERYIVDVYFNESGTYNLMNINPLNSYVLGSIKVTKDPTQISYANSFSNNLINQNIIDDILQFKKYFNKSVDYNLNLTINLDDFMKTMQNLPCHEMGGIIMGNCTIKEKLKLKLESETDHEKSSIEWEDEMNMQATADQVKWIIKDQSSKKQNMDIKMKSYVGDVIKIRLFNDPNSLHPMQHPIHLHGQRFIVTHINNESVVNKVWKDTILVPVNSTIDILVDVTNPGNWMMHCHIAEHLESGMMTTLIVEENFV